MNIASRNPFYIEETHTEIVVNIWVYPQGTTKPADATYTLTKKSFDSTAAEPLRINISPLIGDYYDHVTVNDYPTHIIPSPGIEVLTVDVEIKDNIGTVISTASHTAYDGYQAPFDTHLTHPSVKNKVLVIDGEDFNLLPLYGDLCSGVKYTFSDGTNYTMPHDGSPGVFYAPMIPTQASTVTNLKWIDVEPLRADATASVKIHCEVVCGAPYEDTYTINYINTCGVWESMSCQGAGYTSFKGGGETYISAADGFTKAFNRDSQESLRVNTGFVKKDFKYQLTDLLASNQVELNTNSPWDYGLILKTDGINILHYSSKVFNYTLDFDLNRSTILKV